MPSDLDREIRSHRRWEFTRSPAFRGFALRVAVVTLAFAPGWIQLVRDAWQNSLHAYAPLIPLVSIWFALQYRNPESTPAPERRSRVPAGLLGAAAAACGLVAWAAWLGILPGACPFRLPSMMAAWVVAVWASAYRSFGEQVTRGGLFPLAFLLFTIPIPAPAVDALETGLQWASAWAADVLFGFSGTPYLRDGLTFRFPGLVILVAQECSGIRSTLVLFITGILAARLLLVSSWRRAVIILLIAPLGILRNALRIVSITLLTVHVDPRIIDSPLHHRGGPVFFAVSLLPLFVLLWWLCRQEGRQHNRPPEDR